jgi:phosphate transport system substrate-binding protein
VANGVSRILEVKLGYDGIVIANALRGPTVRLTRKDIFLALAREIPAGEAGTRVPNPHRTWADVNPALPATAIEVLGPPPTSGTRDAFAELAMGGGAKFIPELKALRELSADQGTEIKSAMAKLGLPEGFYQALEEQKGKAPKGEDLFDSVAYAVREDGAYIEAGENDNLIVQKLDANPNAVGIFGFSFLEENGDKVQGSLIDGVTPTFETIASGDYPVSRPLYFYIKRAHVGKIPGIQEYAVEFTSNKAMGEDGYLPEKGLIPLADDELKKVQADVKAMTPLKM